MHFSSVTIAAAFSLIKLLPRNESNSNYDYPEQQSWLHNRRTRRRLTPARAGVSYGVSRINVNLLATDDRRGVVARNICGAMRRHVKRYRTSVCQSSRICACVCARARAHTHVSRERRSMKQLPQKLPYSRNCYYRVTGLISSIKC